jgi:hypothetical protein
MKKTSSPKKFFTRKGLKLKVKPRRLSLIERHERIIVKNDLARVCIIEEKGKRAKIETSFNVFSGEVSRAFERINRIAKMLRAKGVRVPSKISIFSNGAKGIKMVFFVPKAIREKISVKRFERINPGKLKKLPLKVKIELMETIARIHAAGLTPVILADWLLLFEKNRFKGIVVSDLRFFEPFSRHRAESLVDRLSNALSKKPEEEEIIFSAYKNALELAKQKRVKS